MVRNYCKKIKSLITEIKTLGIDKTIIDTKQKRNKCAVCVLRMLYQQNFIFCEGIWTLFYRQREQSEYLKRGNGTVIYVIQKDHSDTVVRMDGIGRSQGGIKAECLGQEDQWYAYSPVLFSLIIHFQKEDR